MRKRKQLREKLTYANVMVTILAIVVLGGGVAYGASQLGKNSVGTKQLKKNSVTAAKIKKNAVTSAKIKNNAVTTAKINNSAVNFAKIAAGTNVIASTTSAGPVSAKQEGPVSVPLSSPLTVTPVAGQPITVDIEAQGTLVQTGTSPCHLSVLPLVNGNPMIIGELLTLESPESPPELFPGGIPVSDVSFPVGLTQPGKAQAITLEMVGDKEHCTSGSTLDQVAIVATQAK